ncbi:MAG: hypothetical protein LUD72_03635 [Bacteroidales bacterium]|nr:hypothetical protein [Bacteroidales bacterium]
MKKFFTVLTLALVFSATMMAQTQEQFDESKERWEKIYTLLLFGSIEYNDSRSGYGSDDFQGAYEGLSLYVDESGNVVIETNPRSSGTAKLLRDVTERMEAIITVSVRTLERLRKWYDGQNGAVACTPSVDEMVVLRERIVSVGKSAESLFAQIEELVLKMSNKSGDALVDENGVPLDQLESMKWTVCALVSNLLVEECDFQKEAINEMIEKASSSHTD